MDIEHAPKFKALMQLLNDCGIGTGTNKVVSEHRALIFCQHKAIIGETLITVVTITLTFTIRSDRKRTVQIENAKRQLYAIGWRSFQFKRKERELELKFLKFLVI